LVDFYDLGGVNGTMIADILRMDNPIWDWSGSSDFATSFFYRHGV